MQPEGKVGMKRLSRQKGAGKMPAAIVLALGGHTYEAIHYMDRLSNVIEPSYLICDDNKSARRKIRVQGPRKVIRTSFETVEGKKPIELLVSFFNLLVSAYQSGSWLLKQESKCVFAFGSGACFSAILAAKILRRKVVFVESACRVSSRSLCGDIVYRFFSDLFVVQWKDQLGAYPRAVYEGRAF